MGPTKLGEGAGSAASLFSDARKTVGLANAPRPGSVSPDLFFGEFSSSASVAFDGSSPEPPPYGAGSTPPSSIIPNTPARTQVAIVPQSENPCTRTTAERWRERVNQLKYNGGSLVEKKEIIRKLASLCTQAAIGCGGHVGQVARTIGGALVNPPSE